MFFAKMNLPAQKRVTLDAFGGYDARVRCEKGAFAAMKNLCSDRYPTLSIRPRRGTVSTVTNPHGMIGKDCLIWVDGATLFINGLATELVLSDTEKQLVSMGAYLVIFPDKKYINTQDLSDYGSLENTVTTTGEVTFSLCDREGTDLAAYTMSATPPAPAESGALWWDGGENVLKRYIDGIWEPVTDVCVKVSAAGIGSGFQPGDGVVFSGCTASHVDGLHLLTAVETNSVIFPGLPDGVGTQSTAVTVSRYVPEMDYVVECGNRLWGCKYGLINGEAVNEIYASALGDFRNWNTYAGLSTDSYAAQRGSDGVFTGAVAYLGNPIFFKEDCMECVYISNSGAHQIVTVKCDGVKKGSSNSLQIVDGTLYYHSSGGVCAFAGSLPVCVSQGLGEARYHDGIAGGAEGKYYLSVLDDGEEPVLFCYDTRRKLWYREDELRCRSFAVCDGELFALTEEKILSMQGKSGDLEDAVEWFAESGDWGLNTPENTYLQRLEIRLKPETHTVVQVFVSYDGGQTWQGQGSLNGQEGRIHPSVLYVRPARCSMLRVKLSGRGDCTIYSAAAVYEKGSDVV